MRLVARKGKFVCVFLIVILSGSLAYVSTLCSANGLTKTLDAWRAYSMLRLMLCI